MISAYIHACTSFRHNENINYKTEIKNNKTFKKRKIGALRRLTLRRSQKHYEIFSNNVLRENITRKRLRLETIEIA